MRLLYLSLCCFSLCLASCLSEKEEILPVSEASATEVEVVSPESTDGNFTIGRANLSFENAYLYSSLSRATGGMRHHLIFSENPVAAGEHLTGTSKSLSIVLFSPDEEISGAYSTDNEIGQRSASYALYYNALDFTTPQNTSNNEFEIGEVIVSKTGGEYEVIIAYEARNYNSVAEGKFSGALKQVIPVPVETPSQTEFQGENVYSFGEYTFPLNHAYLYLHRRNTVTGRGDYRLVLTDEELTAEDGSLTGIANAIIYEVDSKEAIRTSIFGIDYRPEIDFLGADDFVRRTSPRLCTNMNFSTGQYDIDIGNSGETRIIYEGDSFMIRLTGDSETNGSGGGLYRGSLTIVE